MYIYAYFCCALYHNIYEETLIETQKSSWMVRTYFILKIGGIYPVHSDWLILNPPHTLT